MNRRHVKNQVLKSESSTRPGVSFVVCCYNSAKTIVGCLTALKHQSTETIRYEVILVDNNCSDDTIQLARSVWDKDDVQLIIVREPKPGLMHARRKGASYAKFSITSFIDDDNYPNPGWVQQVCRLMESMPEVGVIGGQAFPLLNEPVPPWFKRYQKDYACGKQQATSGFVLTQHHVWGAGLTIRTELLTKILFNSPELILTGRVGKTLTSGEDSEICHRAKLLKWKLWYEDDLTFEHDLRHKEITWSKFLELQNAFGHCSIVLFLYIAKIEGKPFSRRLSIFKWCLKDILRVVIKQKGNVFKQAEGQEWKRQLCRNLGTLKGLRDTLRTYPEIKSTVSRCAKPLL